VLRYTLYVLAPVEAVQLSATEPFPPVAVNPVGWPGGTPEAVTVTMAVWVTVTLAEFVTVSV
jgi:hypothetical protein